MSSECAVGVQPASPTPTPAREIASRISSSSWPALPSTTSTEQSGLFAHLLPEFKKTSGIEVRVVAQGTAAEVSAAPDSLTGRYLLHAIKHPLQLRRETAPQSAFVDVLASGAPQLLLSKTKLLQSPCA